MTKSAYCDGIRRRDFLKAGTLGVGGLGLASLLRLEALGAVPNAQAGKSAIFIYLPGGQSHLDTFDLKPEASEVAGEFRPIPTNVPGIEICEHLPRLAQQADKYTILRSVEHTLAAHAPGQSYLRSGSKPIPSLEYPNYGSVIAKEYSAPLGIPPYVSLPVSRTNGGVETAGYLGVAYSSFSVGADPNAENFSVRALAAPGGLTMERIESRIAFMQGLDTAFRTVDVKSQDLDGMDRFYQQAYDILRSAAARKAFDIHCEEPNVRERYGRTPFGQGCLLARRLVEVGVRCVAIDYGSWDTHRDNFTRLKGDMLPTFDAGVAALLEDLAACGLLDNTVVWVTGEFGRTPKINQTAGRDHWARAMSMLLAGGGIRGRQVIGKTNDKGEEPVEDACKPDDVAASFFHALGIDHTKEYHTPTNRPVMLVRDGQVIDGLFA
ncbi:MAG: DUF1501 domain-containing protein [Planctomycetes bacterium]|nr:DUF1501 domain-containing protein [Planctomycetota bacterium]